jgi:uncharacterized radical SAM superfamily Fe-S cluster-containing enzyme
LRGHPVLIDRAAFPEIRNADGNGGLRAVLSRFAASARDVQVFDEAILLDMDLPADYGRVLKLAANRDFPTPAECQAILEAREVREDIVRHCRGVADVADKLTVSLVRSGKQLNPALIQSASLLHDIAKNKHNHARVGARIVRALGFAKVAEIVGCHSDLDFSDGVLDEAAIVYLADKLVQGDKIVTLGERFAPSVDRFGYDEAVLRAVLRRWATAEMIARHIEQCAGMPLMEIIAPSRQPEIALSPVVAIEVYSIPYSDDLRGNGGASVTVLSDTQSVCPVCLQRIAAQRIAENGSVYLRKTCPRHNQFKTVIWRGEPSYQSWAVTGKKPVQAAVCSTGIDRGCPFDCGLCPDHRQQTCCVLLEVTQRCNLTCPYCFAASPSRGADPSLREIEEWFYDLLQLGGPFNIQLSGGEPTVRNDLPEIIALAHSLGFGFVQLNTNGLRLAEDAEYVHRLKKAGLNCVFLQFDGVSDDVYQRIRGRELFDIKQQAIRHCQQAHLGVVLVPTLVPGVNTEQIGDLLRFAIEHMPTVRAVHFQPVSYFGRYPQAPADSDRITIPEVLRAIEQQTAGKIRAAHFSPPSAENAYCSFQGKFVCEPDGTIKPCQGPQQQAPCCSPAIQGGIVQIAPSSDGRNQNAARRAQAFVAQQWSFPAKEEGVAAGLGEAPNVESLDSFLRERADHTLSISGMAFQDAWTLDLERLKECFIHVVGTQHRLIPLCAYNLTDTCGNPLYRRESACPPSSEAHHA